MSDKPKHDAFFSAIPWRAVFNRNITHRQLRVLAVIAAYDWMSNRKGGSGCFRTKSALARQIGIDRSDFQKDFAVLAAAGLVTEEHREGRKRPSLRVVFDNTADQAARLESVGDTPTDESEGVAPTLESEARGQHPQSDDAVGDTPTRKKSYEAQLINSVETGKHSKELACIENARSELSFEQWVDQLSQMETTHAQLASFERKWKAHPEWFADNHEAWRSWLFRKYEATIGSDSQRAGRLLEEFYIHEPQPEVGEFLDKLQLDRFARHLNKELYQHGKDPRAPTAREIARHPACIAAGLTEVRISQIRNKKAKVVRMSQWDAFALALTERKEHTA